MNACGETTPPTITGYDCWKLGGNGGRHPAGCKVQIAGPTIEIKNTGGVGTHIEWTVEGERGKVGATVVQLPFLDLARKRA